MNITAGTARAPASATRSLPTSIRHGEGSKIVVNLFLGLWLFIATAAVFPLLELGSGSTLSDDSTARLRLLLLPGLIAAPILVAMKASAIFRLLRAHPALLLLLLWTLTSSLWSVDPEISARRALSLIANSLIVAFMVVTLTPAQILRLLITVVLSVLCLSIAFAILMPDLAFMSDLDGAFRGVFTHKNAMGLYLFLTAMLMVVGARTGVVSPRVATLALATVAALVVPTKSSTALLLLVLLVALHLPLAVAGLPRQLAAIGLTFLGLAALAVGLPLFLARNRIFMAFGRDPTLTGRTEVWAFVQGLIDQRPLLGYGYAAMFERKEVTDHLFNAVGWAAPNAHNGYLELWLGIGLIGLVLAVGLLALALVRAWRCIMVDPRSIAGCLAYFYIPLYLFRNFSESDLVAQTDLTWIVAVLAALLVRRTTMPECVPGAPPAPSVRRAAAA